MASTRLGYLAVSPEASRGVAVKPVKFLRFKEGDIMNNQEIVENNPIQNNRFNAINAVAGKKTNDGSFTLDVDPNELLFWLQAALGQRQTTDVGTPTNATVFEHVLDHACKVGSLSVEQAKGELCDDPLAKDGQTYEVARSFGVMVDSIKLSGADTILNCEVSVKAHGQFVKAKMISNPSSGTYYRDTIEGLVVGDIVKIYKGSDDTYENLEIATLDPVTNSCTFDVAPSGTYVVANKVKMELIPQTPSYQDIKTMSFHNVKFRFADTIANAYNAIDDNVENWEIDFTNGIEERFGSKRQSASVIGEKGAGCKIKYEKYFENTTDRDRYLDQEQQALVVFITNNEIVSGTDTTQKKYTIAFEFPDIRFTNHEMPTGTDELYAYTLEGSAFYDSTAGRAVRIRVINKNNSAFYS